MKNQNLIASLSLSVVILLCVVPDSLQAQRVNFHDFNSADGLPQSQIRAIYQDCYGYIWVGSFSGVSRYNGHSFTTFDSSSGLNHNSISDITGTDEGILYIGTEGGGIAVYDGVSFTHITAEDGLADSQVKDLFLTDDGELWVATNTGISKIVDGKITTFGNESGLEADLFAAILKTSGGQVLVGTSGGLYELQGDRFHLIEDHLIGPDCTISFLMEDSRGAIWLGTLNGLITNKSGAWEEIFAEDGSRFRTVVTGVEDSEGALWFGTYKGVYQISGTKIRAFTTENGLINNLINAVILDHESTLWFGTDDGISKFPRSRFESYDSTNGLPADQVMNMFEDSSGRKYFITHGGIAVFYQERWSTLSTANGLPTPIIFTGIEESPGVYILSAYNGLFRWDGSTVQYFPDSHRIRNLFKDSRGVIWAGGAIGAGRIEGDNFIWVDKNSPHADISVNCIIEDQQGSLWFGTSGKGCVVVDPEGNETIYDSSNGLSNQDIWSMDVDSNGTVWIGTNGDGLFACDSGVFTRYSSADGLANNFAWQVLVDNNDHVWIGTNAGLDVLDNGSFSHYDTEDGLNSNEGYADSCMLDSEGTLWFSSGSGISRTINVESIYEPITPAVVIEQMSVSGTSMPLTDRIIELNPQDNDVSIYYGALSYRKPTDIIFRYKLLPLDEEWSDATRDRTVTFGNLPAGNYTFGVQASNDKGITWSESTPLRFHIAQPFYLSLGFLLPFFLAIIAAIYLIVYNRVNRVRKEKDTLEDLVRQRTLELLEMNKDLKRVNEDLESRNSALETYDFAVSHDLRGPINRILSFSQLLSDAGRGRFNEEELLYIDKIQDNCANMNELIGALLDISRMDQTDLEYNEVSMTHMARDIIFTMKDEDSKSTIFTIEDDLVISADSRLMRIMLQNLLMNAWKFTRKVANPEITFGKTTIDYREVFFIRDNGIGFDSDMAEEIFQIFKKAHSGSRSGFGIGLALVRRIVNRQDGKVWAESEPGKGATFYFHLGN